jgi:heavy metal efflux system protein
MIDRLIELSVRNRALVIVLALVFVALGLIGFSRVSIDAVPDVTNVQVQVITSSPSLGPVDVETYVTAPIERSMAGLPGLEEVRSVSRAGISVVTVTFSDDTELNEARNQVNQRLQEAKRDIPEGDGDPQLGPLSSGLGEVYHFEVKGDAHPLMERRTLLDWQITPRLRLVPGVVEVNAFGGEARALEISINPLKLASAKLGVSDVISAIERNNVSVGGAYVVDGRENLSVRGEGRVKNASDLESLVIRKEQDPLTGAAPIFLRDVAEIREAPMVRYGAVTRDGRKEESVVGVVMMVRGGNSGETVARIKDSIADIQKSLPAGVTLDGYYDRTELVARTVKTVGVNLVEASALVMLVLLLTLGNLRAGVVVAIAIPLALLGVFMGMWGFKVSGNLISLGAIDFGLVVDGSIIIVENAMRRMAERNREQKRALTSEERSHEVIEAAKEVRSATAFGEVIIALVYVPLLALGSVEGRMFRPMALTVLFALATAFVLSITLAPALASLLLPLGSGATEEHDTWLIRHGSAFYRKSLTLALTRPLLVVALAAAGFVGSLLVGNSMGREFLPTLDEGTIVLAMVRLPSVSLEQALEQSRDVESALRKYPEVVSVVSRTGRAEIAVDPMGMNMTDVYVMLRPHSEWKTAHDREGLIEAFDKTLKESVPGASFAFSQPIEMNTSDLLSGVSSDLAINVYGEDSIVMQRLANEVMRSIKQVPGARDVRAEQIAGVNVLSAEVDRFALARHGVDADQVMKSIAAVGGIEVGHVTQGQIRIPIQVRMQNAQKLTPEDVSQIPIRAAAGYLVPLGELAHVTVNPGPSQVHRERLSRRITVEVNVRGRDIGTFVDEAKRTLGTDVKFPPGYSISWAGEYERLESATKQLLVVIPITLLLIFVLLVATFGKIGPASVIFLNVPLAVSGGIFALALRGMSLSVSAGIGFIALFGVAVLNGLVLVSSLEHSDKITAHEDAASSVASIALGRFRAVLTTALVASLGFLPMAFSTGAGAEVQRPLATVVIGGLVTSTLLTLFVLPAIYLWISQRKVLKSV